MRKPTLLFVLGLFGCLTLAVVAQPPPAAEPPGVDARNRIKDLQAKFQPWKPAPEVLRSLAVLEELVGDIRTTQHQLLRLAAHNDPQVRKQALVVLAEVSRGMDNEREMVKELGKFAVTANVPSTAVGAYLGLARMGLVARPMLLTAREGRKHKDPEIRRAAYVFLSSQFRLDQEAMLQDVIAALDDPDQGPNEKAPGINSVSGMAIDDLRRQDFKANDKDATAKLVKIIKAKKGNDHYELCALAALAHIAPQERLILEIARDWLKKPDRESVRNGAGLLGALGSHGKDGVPDLIAAAKREPAADPLEEQGTKIVIVGAFEKLGPVAKEALPTLQSLVTTSDITLRQRVQLAIDAVQGKE